MASRSWFRRRIAVPGEHGSWALFLGPLVIGIVAGGAVRVPTIYLVVAALAGFMVRQPITMLAKVRAGRRPESDAPAARFWIVVYGTIAALHIGGLVARGFGEVLYLALPGVPVFAWYLHLVMHRQERRQMLIEVLATGALALSAPAALWIGRGDAVAEGWMLWALCWVGYGSEIVHTYLRLDQRTWSEDRDVANRFQAGRTALRINGLGIAVAGGLVLANEASPLLLVPFGIHAAECLHGVLRPARGLRPRAIGLRQLAVSVLFTATFALAGYP